MNTNNSEAPRRRTAAHAKTEASGSVQLVGLDSVGEKVIEQVLSLPDFHEETWPLLDDRAYRSKMGIIQVRGTIRTGSNSIHEEFAIHYDSSGNFLHEASRLPDGTEGLTQGREEKGPHAKARSREAEGKKGTFRGRTQGE